MRVRILGTRGNIPLSARHYARHAGILVGGAVMLDFGEASYLRHEPGAIFVTHLHPDHAAFSGMRMPSLPPIFVPERTRALPDARLMTRPVTVGGYRVIPVPTRHSHKVRSLGYVVEQGRRRLFYSSDLLTIDRRYHSRLECLDLVITDGSFMRRGGMVRRDPRTRKLFGHAGIPDLVDFFRRFTRRIVITHFGSWFYHNIPASRRQIGALGDGVRVVAARDDMVINL
ncbi:MAG TPA: MBL fold metallo-hydrolase [Gemmatimonadaceae bacterium]